MEILWLLSELERLGIVVETLCGWSKGGSQACYIARKLGVKRVIGFGSFPAWFRGRLPGVIYVKRGDIVPLLSRWRYNRVEVVGEEVLPLAKAHKWSEAERLEIIRLEQRKEY